MTTSSRLGKLLNHPELSRLPFFSFGHSNGTGFAGTFASQRPDRAIAWISYHSGGAFHLQFPGVEKVPGLAMHGQIDPFSHNGQEQTIKNLRKRSQCGDCPDDGGKRGAWARGQRQECHVGLHHSILRSGHADPAQSGRNIASGCHRAGLARGELRSQPGRAAGVGDRPVSPNSRAIARRPTGFPTGSSRKYGSVTGRPIPGRSSRDS